MKMQRQRKLDKVYEAYLRAQSRYLDRPTHNNWSRKEALMEAYRSAAARKNVMQD